MAFCRIGADDKYDIRVVHVIHGIAHRPASERLYGGCNGGGMTQTGAVIYVIGSDDCAGKLLDHIVVFVCALC